MVGITRSQISHFMNKFRKLGFVDYSDNGGLTVQGACSAWSCTTMQRFISPGSLSCSGKADSRFPPGRAVRAGQLSQ